MQATQKPAAEKGKAKKKGKAKAEPAQPKAKATANYVMKKHKKKSQTADGGSFYIAAIHDKAAGKQLAQLSENATGDYETVVKNMVSALNNGEATPEECIDKLNKIKVYR